MKEVRKAVASICVDCKEPFGYWRGLKGALRRRCDPCLAIEQREARHFHYLHKQKPKRDHAAEYAAKLSRMGRSKNIDFPS